MASLLVIVLDLKKYNLSYKIDITNIKFINPVDAFLFSVKVGFGVQNI